MITTLEEDLKKKRSNLFEKDLTKNFVDKDQNRKYQKSLWFKGCRYR